MIIALGGGLAVYDMPFYATQKTTQFSPEFVAYAYFPIEYNLLFRTGMRFNYAWDQTKNTQSVQINQTDFRYYADIGLAYNWIVIPSISLGLGADYRTIKLHTEPPIYVPEDHISNSKNLGSIYIQASVGFPLIKGALVIEPYGRYTLVENPGTDTWGFGIEATVQIY